MGVDKELSCPVCKGLMIGIEYPWDHLEHYDGISEYECGACGQRIGRWSDRVLSDGEVELKSARFK